MLLKVDNVSIIVFHYKKLEISLFEIAFSIYLSFNPRMHEVGPRGLQHYIFGDQFYPKKCQKV